MPKAGSITDALLRQKAESGDPQQQEDAAIAMLLRQLGAGLADTAGQVAGLPEGAGAAGFDSLLDIGSTIGVLVKHATEKDSRNREATEAKSRLSHIPPMSQGPTIEEIDDDIWLSPEHRDLKPTVNRAPRQRISHSVYSRNTIKDTPSSSSNSGALINVGRV